MLENIEVEVLEIKWRCSYLAHRLTMQVVVGEVSSQYRQSMVAYWSTRRTFGSCWFGELDQKKLVVKAPNESRVDDCDMAG